MSNYHSENKETTEQEPDAGVKRPEMDWKVRLASQVMEEWRCGRQYVSDLDQMFDDVYGMLHGERPIKNYDWQSNLAINKVFQVVWTAIPYLVQKVFGATPIIGVKSFDKKGAWQRETILDFWYNMHPSTAGPHIPFFVVMVAWTLRALLNGTGYAKKSWHQRLETKTQEREVDVPVGWDEQAGGPISEKATVKTKVEVPVEDWPVTVPISNKDVVVDWMLQPGQSCRQGRFVIHRALVDLDFIKGQRDIDYFDIDLIPASGTNPNLESRTDRAQGNADAEMSNEPPKSDVYTDVELYERQGKFPVYKEKRDGQYVPCFEMEHGDDVVMMDMIATVAVTQPGEGGQALVRFEPNPNEEITIIDMHIYLDSERWQSVGMVEPIRDVQTALNDNINAMFDEIWQNLMPPVIVNKYALWDWDTMQHAPGQRWTLGSNPAESIMFKDPTRITGDAWQKHLLLDNEIQLTTSITPPMSGMGKEKTATTNVLNAQMSAGKLDFLVKMIEQTALIPCAQMDIRMAKRFAHPKTFEFITGKPFMFGDYEEVYRYQPGAASVKLEYQKEIETQQDIQLIQIFSSVPNPNTPKILNKLWANILRNRNMPDEAAMFDEDYFEPQSEAGNVNMMQRMLGGGSGSGPSNQSGVPMSQPEQVVRSRSYSPVGLAM